MAGALHILPDSLSALETVYMAQIVRGLDATPEDHAALLEGVTAEDMVRVAQSVELDAVYFLRGEMNE